MHKSKFPYILGSFFWGGEGVDLTSVAESKSPYIPSSHTFQERERGGEVVLILSRGGKREGAGGGGWLCCVRHLG